MQKSKRLVLSRERLRNLTPDSLGRVLGGEPTGDSFNELCNSLECNTLLNGITNTFTITNLFTNLLTDLANS